jgi:hypothetical protein
MSMSEFERRLRGSEDDLSHIPHSMQDQTIPEDFSEEDIEFAQEMGTLFSPDLEEMPPFFVQTLLESESPRFQPVEHGFEHKVRARVFRRLKLRRRLFHTSRSSASLFPVQRSFAALVAAVLLFMLMTMVVTGNSFAAGMVYLFSGPHSGVVQMHNYPVPAQQSYSAQSSQQDASPPRLSLLEMQQNLNFQIQWPSYLPVHYNVDSVNLYKGSENVWTDGPIMQLVCTLSLPGVQPHGSGNIIILELKPLGDGKVLQGVAINSSHQIKIGPNGEPGLVVNGQWQNINKTSHTWVDNGSVELIYERNGVIFWIQGDQRDGIDKDGRVLAAVAKSLEPLDVSRVAHMSRFDGLEQSADDLGFTYVGDIYETDILVVSNSDRPALAAKAPMHLS